MEIVECLVYGRAGHSPLRTCAVSPGTHRSLYWQLWIICVKAERVAR